MDRLMVGGAHPTSNWPKTYQDAMALQEDLRYRVEPAPLARQVRLLGDGNETDLAAKSHKLLIWIVNRVGLILRTPNGKKLSPRLPLRPAAPPARRLQA